MTFPPLPDLNSGDWYSWAQAVDGSARNPGGTSAGTVSVPAATGNATTDTANLQAAITSAQVGMQDLYIPGNGQSYKLNTGLTWNLAKGSIIGVGQANIDCSTIPSGPALTVTANGSTVTSGVYPHGSVTHRIANLHFFGPDTDAGLVDGIFFTDVSVGDFGSLEHVRLYGFRDGLSYGDNVWLVSHTKVEVSHCHRYGINGTMGVNAGEEMHFFGCGIHNCTNASRTGTGFYRPTGGNSADFAFYGTSFDYNDIEGDINSGFSSFVVCHIEDSNSGPMFLTSATGGVGPTQVNFIGTNLADTYTGTGGRPVLVTTKASSNADAMTINFISGESGNYNQSTALYANQSTTNPTVTVGGGWYHDVGGPTYVNQYGAFLSSLADSAFESGAAVTSGFGGWSLDANADFYTGLAHSGTHSLRRSGPGTAFQIVPIAPRRPVSITGYVMCNNYTSGSSVFQVQFLAADRSTVLATTVVATTTAAQAWTGYHRRVMAPQGAAFASVQFTASAFVGNVEYDDVQLVSL